MEGFWGVLAAEIHDSADGGNSIDDAIVHNIRELTFESSHHFSSFYIWYCCSFDPSESCKADHHTVHNVYCSLLPLLHLYFSIQQTVFLRLISFMQLCFRSSPEHYNIMAPSLIKITADPPSVFISVPHTLLKLAWLLSHDSRSQTSFHSSLFDRDNHPEEDIIKITFTLHTRPRIARRVEAGDMASIITGIHGPYQRHIYSVDVCRYSV